MSDRIVMDGALRARLLETIAARHPRKSFGYLISDLDADHPRDFLLLEENHRNVEGVRQAFEAWGPYFVNHADAGFEASPDECWRVQKRIWELGMFEVGIFHSHQRHPANFSGIDYELHVRRAPSLWHLIVSMRNPSVPQVRAFDVSQAGVREVEVVGGGVTRTAGPGGAEPVEVIAPRPVGRLGAAE